VVAGLSGLRIYIVVVDAFCVLFTAGIAYFIL